MAPSNCGCRRELSARQCRAHNLTYWFNRMSPSIWKQPQITLKKIPLNVCLAVVRWHEKFELLESQSLDPSKQTVQSLQPKTCVRKRLQSIETYAALSSVTWQPGHINRVGTQTWHANTRHELLCQLIYRPPSYLWNVVAQVAHKCMWERNNHNRATIAFTKFDWFRWETLAACLIQTTSSLSLQTGQ